MIYYIILYMQITEDDVVNQLRQGLLDSAFEFAIFQESVDKLKNAKDEVFKAQDFTVGVHRILYFLCVIDFCPHIKGCTFSQGVPNNGQNLLHGGHHVLWEVFHQGCHCLQDLHLEPTV